MPWLSVQRVDASCSCGSGDERGTIAGWSAIAGDEVAQIYVWELATTMVTPIKSLKGPSRMFLASEEVKAVVFR